MDGLILPLCIAIAVVVAVVLTLEALRIRSGLRRVKERELRLEETLHILEIKQKDRVIKINYRSREEACAASDEEPFPVAERLSFSQKYDLLSEERKALLDRFSDYLCGIEDCVRYEQTNALAFKYKKASVVKAVVRRDCAVLYFAVTNSELGRMMREEKLRNLKVKPVEIRLRTESDLQSAMQTADITVGYLKREEEYRNERRKELRRKARAERKQKEETV